MNEKNELKTPLRSSIKFLDIHSNFKKIRKISPSREQDTEKKKKCVAFFDVPKEFKMQNIKKTQIIRNHRKKSILSNFQTQIDNNFNRKRKSKKKTLKIKSERSTFRMPALKTKVVNINKHYFIPIITKFAPTTSISNPKEKEQKQFTYKRVRTIETKIRKIDNLDDSIEEKLDINPFNIKKRKDSKSKNSENKLNKRKSVFQWENTPFIGDIEDNENNSKKSEQNGSRINNSGNSSKNIENIIKNKETKVNSFESDVKKNEEDCKRINEDKINNEKIIKFEEEKVLENNEKNEIKKKDEDNLTNNSHRKNNSVDSSNKKVKNKWNKNFVKNIFCCLYG